MSDRPGRSLRVRLVAVIAGLILVATAIVVTTLTFILTASLNRQLDRSIETALNASLTTIYAAGDASVNLAEYSVENIFPSSAGSFQAIVVDGAVTSAMVLDQDYVYRPLNDGEQQRLLEALDRDDGDYFVLSFGDDRYRSLAITIEEGDGTTALFVTGEQENPIDSTITVFLLSAGAVTLLVAAGAVLIGSRIVRRALLPLDRVVEISDQVADMRLSEGAIVLDRRVLGADVDEGTEAGRVGLALNRLLDNVEQSLDARHRTEEAMRRFVAEASHELRNPLASIRGYAEHYAATSGVPDDARGGFERVAAESERLGALVDELLTLAKLDAGRVLRRDTIDLSLLVMETVADARMAMPDHEWRIVLPDEPVLADADEAAVRQVLVNLCANAGAHTPPGTTVTVSARTEDRSAVIEVSDTGPGIPPETLPIIFDRFSQGDPSVSLRSRKSGSIGLGLAIVAAIAKASDGEITARSVPGVTVFRFTVPAHDA
ncbi:HAMP domain-containing sensor histidine kinase [Microbacterium luteolum]|nr:HAMP domain-containing sensor histidine kinase [Microbacterium luteolum]